MLISITNDLVRDPAPAPVTVVVVVVVQDAVDECRKKNKCTDEIDDFHRHHYGARRSNNSRTRKASFA
jgi:hypothetical protein